MTFERMKIGDILTVKTENGNYIVYYVRVKTTNIIGFIKFYLNTDFKAFTVTNWNLPKHGWSTDDWSSLETSYKDLTDIFSELFTGKYKTMWRVE